MQAVRLILSMTSTNDDNFALHTSSIAFSISPLPCSGYRRPRSKLCTSQPLPVMPSDVRRQHATAPARWTMSDSTSSSPCLSIDASIMKRLANRRVAITGGTGLIGRSVVSRLVDANAEVHILARDPANARVLFPSNRTSVVRYDAQRNEPLVGAAWDAVTSADAVINLAGEPIDKGRWTPQRKRVLRDSRILGTQRLVTAIQEAAQPPVLVSASAVGYYGTSETDKFTEEAPAGCDFLATIADAWEQAALENDASRTAVLRIGVVLAKEGGALNKMAPLFRAFLGGPPGSGQQWLSWVHLEDIVRLLLHATVEEKWTGIYNATAPQPVQLNTFCKELGRALGRPSWLPVPKQAIQMILGSEAAQLVLAGQQVLPKRTRANGFVYQYKDVGSALQQLFQKTGSRELSRMQ